MTETLKSCPLCGENTFEPFWIYKHRIRPDNTFQICVRCGGVFANPRPTEAELNEYYKSEYREQIQGEGKPRPQNFLEEGKRAQRLAWWLQRYIPTVKRHLDIGSSSGLLLNNIWNEYNCESVGVEPGDEFREASKDGLASIEQPVSIYNDISEVPTTKKFDLITMSHVLEHLTRPVEYLENLVNRYLEPNGHILIEVPNLFGEITALIFPHIIAFTQETLWATMNRAGLHPIAVETSYVGGQIHLAPPPYLTAIGRKGQFDAISESREIYGRVVRQFSDLMKVRSEISKRIKDQETT